MADVLNGTGPYRADSVSGVGATNTFASFTFCSGFVTASGTYVSGLSGDPTIMDFGAMLSEVVIVNKGANDLAIQWKEKWGSNTDCGFVPAGQTVTIRKLFKTGVKVRCADASLTTTCVVWGI